MFTRIFPKTHFIYQWKIAVHLIHYHFQRKLAPFSNSNAGGKQILSCSKWACQMLPSSGWILNQSNIQPWNYVQRRSGGGAELYWWRSSAFGLSSCSSHQLTVCCRVVLIGRLLINSLVTWPVTSRTFKTQQASPNFVSFSRGRAAECSGLNHNGESENISIKHLET